MPTTKEIQPDGRDQQDDAVAKLISIILSGECVLFLGAGVHVMPPEGSEYSHDIKKAIPVGGDLAAMLAQECNYNDKFGDGFERDLQRVALWYQISPFHGRQALIKSLREHLDTGKAKVSGDPLVPKTPTEALKMVAELPFKIIVTTNYDSLLETALRDVNPPKKPVIRVYNPNSNTPTEDVDADPQANAPLLFKMHGDLDRSDSIVITDEDYITFVQRMSEREGFHPVPQTVRYRMQRWPTIFIGYSLRDYNLRLLFRTLRWKIDCSAFPTSFSIDPKPDPLIMHVYQNDRGFVTFILNDLWSFIPRIHAEIMARNRKP